MMYSWDQKFIIHLFEEAKARGHVSAQLDNAHKAKLFRFALYNYRKKSEKYKNLSITLEKNTVTIFSPIQFTIKKKIDLNPNLEPNVSSQFPKSASSNEQ